MSTSIHSSAICESKNIGSNTKVGAFARILSNAVIGEDCAIGDGVFIENDVVIGDRVTLNLGVKILDGVVLENDTTIGPNVTFANDLRPAGKSHSKELKQTTVCSGATVHANATVLSGLVIGKFAVVGAAAVVTQSVPPYAIVVGNPAVITGYVNSHLPVMDVESKPPLDKERIISTRVRGVTLHQFNHVTDLRGSLSVGEFEKEIPFFPKRYFLVFDVPNEKTRGQHAHKKCHQFLICVKGQCSVVADDGSSRQEFVLDSPSKGIYLPPMIWGTQYKYSSDSILLVFASDYYEAEDYVRDYDEFKDLLGGA
ncbi:UDP-2-acetamido-3-amino-2,3-dideoxy-glucuronate N-acetyltransferase [Oxalobacteraceae bacterium GrIS 2.11]